MLCRHCFLSTSGVKGECAGCSKPVVRLRQEGQFVENSGKVWHKKCFECNGCSKNIAANPSVDLFGRPCCPDCFETSLNRPTQSRKTTPRRESGNLGGLSGAQKDASPALEELSRRLGVRSKESTPSKIPQAIPTTPQSRTPVATVRSPAVDKVSARKSVDDLSRRLRANTLDDASLRRQSQDLFGDSAANSQIHDLGFSPSDYVESPAGSRASPTHPAQHSLNTPDLTSDASDDAGSTWSSPPTPKVDAPPSTGDPDVQCDKCKKPLFSISGGGRIVTTPSETGKPGRYHSSCFVCVVCQKPFAEKEGTANFVIMEVGFSHLQVCRI
jgi:LIM domain